MTTYPKTWDDDVVEEYITQESQEKSPQVFLETHLPITHIRAEILHGGDTGFITEQQLLEHIVQSNVATAKNRIYLLKGAVGSGKSHLCQWLEYQLNGSGRTDAYDDEHVAIHISRNNTRLADILDKLYEHIEAEHDDIDDITEYDDYEEVTATLLSMLGTFDADDLSFPESSFDFEQFMADRANGLDLRDVLVDNLRQYRSAVEAEDKEQKLELISREQFREICFNEYGRGFGGEEGDDIFPTVRQAIHDRLLVNLGIENFQEDLSEIAREYRSEGKRPVLICEDVTTFNVLKDDLLDHIFQLGDGGEDRTEGYDIVLGYTTGWESEKADDALTTGDLSFMIERAQGYLTMTDRAGEAYFLREGSMPVRLVRKYLSVIKEHSAPGTTVSDDDFDGMYPFNERFIVRAYRHLQEEGDTQQTPRLLLYHVVADALRSNRVPFLRVVENAHLGDFAVPMSVQQLSTEFRQLVKWYGRKDDGDVVVPATICETFDVGIPADGTVRDGLVRLEAMYSSPGWEVRDEDLEGFDPERYLERRAADAGEVGEIGENGSSSGESDDIQNVGATGTEGTVIDRDDDDEGDRQEKGRRIGQFQNWIGSGDEFPSSDRLKEGVQAALDRFYDPTRLGNPNATVKGVNAFYYTRGDNVPVTIVGADSAKRIGVDVHFDDEEEELYLHLFGYGLDGEFPDSTNFEAVQGWCAEKVYDLRDTMRSDLEGCLPNDSELPSTFELEELLVLAQLFIYNARTGATGVDVADLLEVPEHVRSSPFRDEASAFDVPQGLHEGFLSLNTRRSDVASLCKGFFLLKSNFLDANRIQPALQNVSRHPNAFVDAAARLSATDLPAAYCIGSTRNDAKGSTKAKSFLMTVSDYANELQKLEQEFEPGPVQEDIAGVRTLHNTDHTVDALLDYYERLEESLAPLDASLKTRWTDVGERLKNDSRELQLEDFGSTLQSFEDVDPDNGLEAIALMHEFNESKETQVAWDVYEVLAEMIGTIEHHDDAEGGRFVEELRDEPQVTAFERKRDDVLQILEEI